jgi:hypothetical protein
MIIVTICYTYIITLNSPLEKGDWGIILFPGLAGSTNPNGSTPEFDKKLRLTLLFTSMMATWYQWTKKPGVSRLFRGFFVLLMNLTDRLHHPG